MENLMVKNVSYLHARDPSILAANRPFSRNNVRTNLNYEGEKQDEPDNHIKVYLRIKDAKNFENLYEIDKDKLTCKVPEGSHCMRNMREGDSLKKTYTFSNIFGCKSTQTDIFNSIVKPKMLSFINGENCTLLTYGASGSGKTFTVIGTAEEPGIVPRSLEYLFRTIGGVSKIPIVKPLPNGEFSRLDSTGIKQEETLRRNILSTSTSLLDKTQHTKTYMDMQQRLSREPVATVDWTSELVIGIWVSFAEIYNEYIYDLLQPEPQRGQQRIKLRLVCSQNQNNYIKDLTSINVSSGIEAYQILQYGIHNLNYAATNINSHSSRSHSIFTIKVVQLSKRDGGVYSSSFNFCDLAGSERSKKTQNVGDRLKESNNINSSLLVLGRCMNAIRNAQKQNDHKMVPFRESKLTHLFQKALSGLEDIAMIVNISPVRDMFDETQHVLNFSAIASDITILRQPDFPKPKTKNNRFSSYMQRKTETVVEESVAEATKEELQNVIYFLQRELEEQRIEFEENDKLNRNYIINGYKQLLKDNDAAWEKKMKHVEEAHKLKYEKKIRQLQDELSREKARPTEIINLDSSSDEEDEEVKKDIQMLRQDLKIEREKVVQLEHQNRNLYEQKREFENTLVDAEVEYQRMQREKDEEIFKLHEKCFELQSEVETLRHEILVLRAEDTEDGEENKKEVMHSF